MFTEQANFKGISEEPLLIPPLHVDGIAQKAFIEVNEKGTEAAAVSCKYFQVIIKILKHLGYKLFPSN